MKVVFVDHIPIDCKSDIYSGGHIRRYYAWATLNRMVNSVISFRRENGRINWEAIRCMLHKDSKIWVEYGCGGVAHLFVLFASFIRSKKLIIDVHDLAIHQNYADEDIPFLKRIRLETIERVLLKRANVIILAWPMILDYFTPEKNQKVLIMVPGVGADELFVHSPDKMDKRKKIALYFGGMHRKSAIPLTIELFLELKEWELHLIGLKEGARTLEKDNVKYFGSVSHDELADTLCNADALLIPLPHNSYMNKSIPMKLGYALKSCRPVIVTKLKGISEYVSLLGLEENVIYVDEWTIDSLKEALEEAQNLNIDAEKTIEKLSVVAWEPRFGKAVEIALDTSQATHGTMGWL